MRDKLTDKTRKEQRTEIERVRELLQLSNLQMADAMGASADTFKNWKGVTRAAMPSYAWRVLNFLEWTFNDCDNDPSKWFRTWSKLLDIPE